MPFVAALGALTLTQCSPEKPAATEVIASINSDLGAGTDITRVDVELYDADGVQLWEKRPFQLRQEKSKAGQVTFPFSFGIAKGKQSRFRLVVTGYGPFGEGGKEIQVIEHSVVASFLTGQTALVEVFLGQLCFRKLCEKETTCYSEERAGTAAGTCGAIPELTLEKVVAGAEHGRWDMDAGEVDTDTGAEESDGSSRDATQDVEAGAMERDGALPDAKVTCLSEGAPSCDDGLFCNGVERCAPDDAKADARGCLAGTSVSCAVQEVCDETLDRCSSCNLDDDGDNDSSRAKACGGDDCDDTDPERKPGLAEICDGKDNDCDDSIDGAPASAMCPAPSDGSASCINKQCVRACPPDFVLSGDGLRCSKVDDCEGVTSCAPGSCLDGVRTYTCSCPSSFVGTGTQACACPPGDKRVGDSAICRTPQVSGAVMLASNASSATAVKLSGEASGSVFVAWVISFRTLYGMRKNLGANWDFSSANLTIPITNAMQAVALPDQTGIALFNGSEFDHAIRSTTYTSSGGFSSAVQREVSGTTPNIEPSSLASASDGLGGAWFVWSARDAQQVTRLWSARYLNGAFQSTTLVVPIDAANPNASSGRNPKLAMDGTGRALLAFEGASGAAWSEYENGKFGTPYPAPVANLPQLNAKGMGAVLNSSGSSGTFSGSLSLFDFTTGLGAAQPVFSNSTGPMDYGIDGAGNVLVVWASGTTIHYRRYEVATQSLSAAADAPLSATVTIPSLRVAMGANGDALVTWLDSSASKLWAQRYVAGSGFKPAVTFQANNGQTPSAPQAVVDKFGNAVIVWEQGPSAQFTLWYATLN